MIKVGVERIAIQGRVTLDGYIRLKIRATDETDLEPAEDYLHIYAKRNGSGVIKLYFRDDDNIEREIATV